MTPFTRIQSETLLMEGALRVVRHEVADADGNDLDARVVTLDLPDLVTVVAITPEDDFILVRRHAFGIDAPSLELPAGALEPGEDPAHAASRVLRAQTGYAARALHVGSWCYAHAALQNNRAYAVLAEGCWRDVDPSAGVLEAGAVERHSRARVRELVGRRKIHDALALVALLEHAL